MLKNIPLDYYIFAGLLNFIASVGLAILVLLKNPHSRTNRTFSFFAFTVAGWSLCYFLWLRAGDSRTAEFCLRTLMLFVIFIPTAFTHFVLALLGADFVRKVNLVNYPISLLLGLSVYTRFFADDIGPFLVFPHWLEPRILFLFHTIHFFANTIYSHGLMLRALRRSSSVLRNQLLYVFIGTSIGYIAGAINYLTWYRVPIPPFLNPLVSVYVAAVSYSIVKYHLMDINLAVTRTTVFMAVYAVLLGLPLIGALAWQAHLEQALGPRWWAWLWVLAVFLATAAHYANLHFQRRAEDRILTEERKAHEALRNISQNMMRFLKLNALLRQIDRTLVNILQLTHAAIYLRPEGESSGPYQRKASWHHPPRTDSNLPSSIPADSGLLEDLRTVRLPRVREELKLHQQGISPKWETLAETLTQLQASVAVPVFQQRRLLGVLVLGEKRSGRIWSQDDLNLLMVLANQAALAIENAQLHEAEEQRLIKEAIEQTAADIAYGVSHQFNNRLYVISILSSMQVLSVAEKDLTKLSNEELANLVRKLAGEFKKVTEEAEMGGQISKGIMSLAKAIPENFKPIEIPPVIEHALDFVRIKHAKEKVEGEDLVPTVMNGVPKDLPKILGNHAQIHDSLMNLLDNALDAIREKIYRTRRGELPAAEPNYKGKIQVKAGVENGRLIVSVEDDGIGIEKENMRRCFAPYFTTKATGVKGRGLGGHGLGLYFIKKIVEAHGGIVRAESEHTQWTRFTVELPIPNEEDLKNADAA